MSDIRDHGRTSTTIGALLGALLALGLPACGPAEPAARTSAEPPPVPQASRVLVMAIRGEPVALTSSTGLGSNYGTPIRLFTAGLALKDEQGTPQAYLAEALPQLDTESWRVFPDGRMETTHRLRPNLTWHDGTLLSGDDFVFSWEVYASPAVGFSRRSPQAQIEELSSPDPQTVRIRWNRPFPHAATLMTGGGFDFAPLPRHLLERAFHDDAPDVFLNNPYWTRDYVSAGPFRLDRWEPGAFLEGAAFQGHALGRPRLDRIRVVFIQDANTVLANLLAGEAHVTDDTPLPFEQAMVVRRAWEPGNGGRVLLTPSLLRYAGVQFRPSVVAPRALLDVRVRKALAHAIDKAEFNDGLFDGQGILADGLIVPSSGNFALVDREIAKYPYDPGRTEQLMNEAGYARGTDGFYASPTEGHLALENRISAGANNEREAAILADSLRRAGIDVQTSSFGTALLLDGQYRASYTALDSSGAGVDESSIVHSLSSELIPNPENRWTGQNRGGWTNADYDRLVEAYDTTLDRTPRDQQVADMMKLVNDELPWIPFYFNLRVVAHVSALSGLRPGSPTGTPAWNVQDWELSA